jgi:ABC-2 type transport system ATP-binding protein
MSELSAGQTTRVNLAKAFLNFPKVLLLDEPTASLDPEVAEFIREFLLKERKTFNVSMVFTSHNMAEVEEVCDRVIFINHGQIVANDTPQNLARLVGSSTVQFLPNNFKVAQEFVERQKFKVESIGKYLRVHMKEDAIAHFLTEMSTNKISFNEISIEKPSLEDYFLKEAKERSQNEF